MPEQTFNDYLSFLRQSMDFLNQYRKATGQDDPRIASVRKGLVDPDPFVLYRASVAATILLNDEALYH